MPGGVVAAPAGAAHATCRGSHALSAAGAAQVASRSSLRLRRRRSWLGPRLRRLRKHLGRPRADRRRRNARSPYRPHIGQLHGEMVFALTCAGCRISAWAETVRRFALLGAGTSSARPRRGRRLADELRQHRRPVPAMPMFDAIHVSVYSAETPPARGLIPDQPSSQRQTTRRSQRSDRTRTAPCPPRWFAT